METSSAKIKSRKGRQKGIRSEKLCKLIASLTLAEVDEDGKERSPLIPQRKNIDWCTNAIFSERQLLLKHEKDREYGADNTGDATASFQVDRYRKVASKNLGALTHNEKPRLKRPETREEYWRRYLKELYLKKLEEIKGKQEGLKEGFGYEDIDDLRLDESKQMDFAKAEKRLRRMIGNLRIHDDEREREERDERRRKHNFRCIDKVTSEDMEANRMKSACRGDPMTVFLCSRICRGSCVLNPLSS